MLDADSSSRLGARKLGELADMVSQFEILPTYTQINYQGRPVRVTSLRYGDLIKWFTNRANGLPAYLIIDMVSQEAEVVRLPEGMKYTIAEHFGREMPVIVDNAESVTRLIDTEGQIIRLVVSEADKTLRVEVAA